MESPMGKTEYENYYEYAEAESAFASTSSNRKLSIMPQNVVAAIPQDVLQHFVALYEEHLASGATPDSLRDFDIRMDPKGPGGLSLTERRQSQAHVRRQSEAHMLSRGGITEQLEMTEQVPHFNFRQLVTNMRNNFMYSMEDQTDRKKPVNQQKVCQYAPGIGILNKTIAKIEGKYGAAVMSYFSFLKHAMIINVAILMLSLLIIVPHLTLTPTTINSGNDNVNSCSVSYESAVWNSTNEIEFHEYLIQLVTGSGLLENYIFYGVFKPAYSISAFGSGARYDMSLAMTCIPLACFVISLVMILGRAATHFSSVETTKNVFATRYVIEVLGSWNYSVTGRGASHLQHSLTKNRLATMLAKDSRREKTLASKALKTTLIRLAGHVLVLTVLGGCSYAVLAVQNFSDDQLKAEKPKGTQSDIGTAAELALSFLPSFTITGLYITVRYLLEALARLESYSAKIGMALTIVRAAFLRIASLLLLFAKFFSESWTCPESLAGTQNTDSLGNQNETRVCGNCKASNGKLQSYCWEAYVGQQLYKLVITDFVMVLVGVFIFEYPRGWLYKYSKDRWRLVSKIGLPEFAIPKLVLDVAYTQTLCWLSILFCPYVSAMTLVTMLVLFYARKLSLKRNFKLSEKFSSSSDMRFFFLFLLSLFLVLSLLIVVTLMVFIPPSQGCGPYRTFSEDERMISAVTKALEGSEIAKDVIKVVADQRFLLLVALITSLIIYINMAFSRGNERLAELLDVSKESLTKDNRTLWTEIHRKTRQIAEDSRLQQKKPATKMSVIHEDGHSSQSLAKHDVKQNDAYGLSSVDSKRWSTGHRWRVDKSTYGF